MAWPGPHPRTMSGAQPRSTFMLSVSEGVSAMLAPRSLGWRLRRLILATSDCLAWMVAIVIGVELRMVLDGGSFDTTGIGRMCLLAAAAQLAVGALLHVYRSRYSIGSFDDAIIVSLSFALVGGVLLGFNFVFVTPLVPRSIPVISMLLALLIAVGVRLIVRRVRERRARPDDRAAERAVVYGAGIDGQQLVRAMLLDPRGGFLPVAILDDDPDLRTRRVCGIAVRGGRADLVSVARSTGATLVVIADRNLDSTSVGAIAALASEADLGVKLLPPLAESLKPWVGLTDLRDIDITDLLGRRPVDIDVAAIAGYLTGQRVLVTGAGGSIGSELCRQIHRFEPAELLMLDRDESALHSTQLSLYGSALLDSPDVILADIRDSDAMDDIFRRCRPDVVFHAAALKHLPLLEQYPDEAWKTNVIGTHNVLAASAAIGVQKFVNISTDKAANPTSVLGRSKRLGEMIVSGIANDSAGGFLSVRFGNVLGSRGSVLTTFADQLRNGKPITVTDPDVTRFFMTIPEAVQLVIYAAAIGGPGEALVLDMGEPVRIADVARQLMTMSGRTVEIVYTGLREGEKLHEELFGDGERDVRPIHPSVSHVDVPTLRVTDALTFAESIGAAAAMEYLTNQPSSVQHGESIMVGSE